MYADCSPSRAWPGSVLLGRLRGRSRTYSRPWWNSIGTADTTCFPASLDQHRERPIVSASKQFFTTCLRSEFLPILPELPERIPAVHSSILTVLDYGSRSPDSRFRL